MVVAFACGSDDVQTQVVVQTVVVEKEVPGETIVQTVVVEKEVQVRGETVVQTVIVEKEVQVRGETVVQTVIVEKEVQVRGETIVQTVVVEKEVQVRGETVVQTVIVEVEKEVQVEKVVVATAVPALMSADGSVRVPPQGHFVLAEQLVVPPVFHPALAGGGLEFSYYNWGLVDYPLFIDKDNLSDPDISLWTSWEVASDLSKLSFTVREGVQFHNGWGEMTADDVAFSYNAAIREGSRFYGLTSLDWLDRIEATGKFTGEMIFKEFNPLWVQIVSNASTHQPWIASKRVFDEKGEIGGLDTAIGTGPYKAISWAANERIVLQATGDHWRVVPKIETFEVVEIPEPLAMQAAFLTGEVDIAPIPNSMIKDTFASLPGSTIERIGKLDNQTIHFTGNYWLKGPLTHRSDSSAQFPREGYTPDADHPWIGDIDDPESMERALKVRTAMIMAVDRDSILRNIFDGFGVPEATWTGFMPDDPQWKPEWAMPAYDPDGAKVLLAEAGYADGFSFEFFAPSGVKTINDEAAFAAAQFWREIGLDPQIDNGTYASGRDRRFDGVDNIVRMHHIFTGDLDREKAQGLGNVQAYHGHELPRDILEIALSNRTEKDYSTRIQNNVALTDYITSWRLFLPLSATSTNYMVGPKVIDWVPHLNTQPFFLAPWTVEIKN